MKPNLLHIVDSLEQGGTERQAIQLVRLLHTSGRYRVHLACLQNRGSLRVEAEGLGLGEITEYPLDSFYDRNFVVQLRRCVRFLKEHKIDVVHTHDFYTNIFGMTAARLARVPARIASKRETEGFRSSAQKRAERYAYALAHSVITNANAVSNQLIKEGVRAEKLTTVYNGLDVSRVAPQSDLQRDAMLAMVKLPHEPRERLFVTIVANLQHAVKDHSTFLRAAARVRQEVPQASFVLAGEGALTNDLRALAKKLGIERDTFFVGHCQRIAELLAVSEVCVLSSKAEGFSNSILEYMAAARPVVVTDVGGAREAVIDGETGFIVTAGDDENMAARIITLLREPERARAMGERGRLIVEQKFSCEAQLERTAALYNWLLARPAQTIEPALKGLQGKRA
ncbi:MAG: glycosyltransferase [Acidobacteriota bacterium]|nr:glycosyltransferase [Acidobacteriota bacterium]